MTHAQGSAEIPEPAPIHPESTPQHAKKVKSGRISGVWVAVIVAMIVLVLLLIFILQNLDTVNVHFFGMDGSMPLAVAMLFSVIAGGALVALIGGARILQLRRQVRR